LILVPKFAKPAREPANFAEELAQLEIERVQLAQLAIAPVKLELEPAKLASSKLS
jgi:hypothetical protein